MYGQYWYLYADPRIKTDAALIDLFNHSNLLGVVIPVGASAGEPELRNGESGENISIKGNKNISDFLMQNTAN